ncbi:MAG TPA: hypothetical protein VFN96_06220 [Gemmatimonadales bacterium]|nr:hypothetical protein [Gemmatimonadales bacterium]
MTRPAALFACVSLLGFSAAPLAAQGARRPAAPPARGAQPSRDTAGGGGIRAAQLAGLRFRNIGPALASGRIGEIVVHPADRSTWYVAVHSGGVWKTVNAGTTWTPLFDGQASYSIGTVALDPSSPLTVWVGSGENNSQRSVGFGDGIYRSTDGGRSWTNLGLKGSGHIGKILVHPTDSRVVYVSAIGPLWSPGGDRGVYKTTDGGKSWVQSLKPDNEWTGAYDLAFDPRDPDVMYATTWQRARRQWGFIDGGPGSALWKTTDGGATWSRLSRGLPTTELGKIGLAVSPASPNTVYAIVEAASRAGGFYRSEDGGQNWSRMNPMVAGPPFYYHKLFADPKDPDRVYSMDVRLMMTEDGGRTWRSVQGRSTHVDNHALWIDPDDTRHLLLGNDGGMYQSFDRGATWQFVANLPVTQFYKVDVAQSESPFYLICGGTQDNNTLCGPSATRNSHGASNADWFITVGGDGFQPRIDPENATFIYSQSQHGELVRYDRRTGERVEIQPQPGRGEPALRWHWDSPLIVSPHRASRIYFGSQRLFRSDDRGDTWRPVSPDLTRQIDRSRLRMMGRRWSVDAVARNTSTSFFGTIVALAESPRREGLLFAGTDDGILAVTENDGGAWRRIEHVEGVPDTTFVADVEPSRHDAATVYAAFNNHKAGDFRPYLLKSTDLGRTWTSIAGNLPERGPVWTIVEDHLDPDLLFAGTEFGAYFSLDGGRRWTRFGGLPTIPVRDIVIHRQRNDLVLATFGRGFYVLDDYSPLRALERTMAQRAALLPVPDARMYVPASPLGGGPRGSQGDALWTTPNPPAGVTITYWLRDELRTRRTRRQEEERALVRRNEDVPVPSWDTLRLEDREEPPAVLFTIADEQGNVIRRLSGPAGSGLRRITWDLRYPAATPITSAGGPPAGGGGGGGDDDDDDGPGFGGGGSGPMVVPGTYRITMSTRVDGVTTRIAEQTVRAELLGEPALAPDVRAQVGAFHQQTARLQRAAMGANGLLGETEGRLAMLRRAIDAAPRTTAELADRARALAGRLRDLRTEFSGDNTISSRSEPVPPTVMSRIQRIVRGTWSQTGAPTATHRQAYAVASAEFGDFLPKLRSVVEEMRRLEAEAETAGAPWTPGRVPVWEP